MRIPRYWAKSTLTSVGRNPRTGKSVPSRFWGWSDVSPNDAVEVANRRLVAMAERIERREFDRKAYSYGELPMREPILDEWKNAAGETWAMVTVNKYGCQVLNTAAIMFVDIDLPDDSAWNILSRSILGLFGKSAPTEAERERDTVLGKIRATVERQPGFGVRVYKTRGGLRYLMTCSRIEPDSDVTLAAMQALNADPKYVMLCKTQACFRARLTPKPWRCGMRPLRIHYPWKDEAAKQGVDAWRADYSRKAESFATCELIEHLGNTAMDDEMARLVEFHDKATRAGSKLELA